MFSHITVGTNDMDVAHRFYDALFAAMGHVRVCSTKRVGCCTSRMGGCSA